MGGAGLTFGATLLSTLAVSNSVSTESRRDRSGVRLAALQEEQRQRGVENRMLSGIAPLFAPTTVLGLVADENLRSPPIPVLLVELADIVQDRDSLHRPEKVQPAGHP